MRRGVVVALLALAALPAATALAQDAAPAEVADAASRQGYYVEEGAEADEDALASIAAQMAQRGSRFVPVVLASRPDAGPTVFADGVLDRLGSGTVVVLVPSEIGYASSEYSSARLDQVAGDAIQGFRRSPADGFRLFASGLLAGGAAGREAPRGGGVPLLGILVVGAIVLFAFNAWRSRRYERAETGRRVTDAREEIRGQIAQLADGIVELADPIAASDNAEAKRRFRDASDTYASAETELARASTPGELERLADRLDHARWQVAAARAALEGREMPVEPSGEPASCFFDPTHGAGVEAAEVQGPRGSVPVHICSDCAEKLRHGEAPEPRRIRVNGQEVPAGAAPRSFGGFGLGWLGPFTVLLPGAGGVFYDWGLFGRRRRGRYGGFGVGGFGMGGFGMGGGVFRGGGFGGGGRGRGGMRIPRGRGGRGF